MINNHKLKCAIYALIPPVLIIAFAQWTRTFVKCRVDVIEYARSYWSPLSACPTYSISDVIIGWSIVLVTGIFSYMIISRTLKK